MKKKVVIILVLAASVTAYFYLRPGMPLDKSAVADRILVEKGKRKLTLWSKGVALKTYRVSLGRNPKGDKQFRGDNKTPEGLYDICCKGLNKYHKYLCVSYPAEQDILETKKLNKNADAGGQILVHGIGKELGWVGKLHLLRDWTQGCIAVTNREIDEIYTAVPVGTPIEIVK